LAWVCKSIKTCDVNLNTSLKQKNVSGLCNGIFYDFFLIPLPFFMLIIFSLSFHVCCSLWNSKERQNKLKEKEDYTCGKWKVVSHFFLLFGFILIFLNAIRIFVVNLIYWYVPKLLDRFKYESEVKTKKVQGIGAHSLARITLGVEGCVGVPGWD